MAARTGSGLKPSNQTPADPPQLTPELARAVAATPRRMAPIRRAQASGEVWLQSDEAPDGWIRARVIEAGPGFLGLLAHAAPPVGRGTWARLGGHAPGEADQIRIFPVAASPVGNPPAPVFLECEIPADPALIARFLRSSSAH